MPLKEFSPQLYRSGSTQPIPDESLTQPANAAEYRAAMVNALNSALEIFCFHSEATIDQVMTNGLFPIADAMNVNRIIIYRHVEIDGESRLKQLYRWVREDGGLSVTSLDLLPNTSMIKEWMDTLKQDQCVNERLSDLSGEKIAFMNTFGIKSVFFAPIFTLGEFWGCITFQDHVNERRFQENCVDITRSFAYLCANAIIRAEMVQEAAEKNEFNHAIFSAVPLGLTTFDENYNFIDCNDAVLEIYGVTKQYYLTHFFELSPEYQNDGSKSYEKLFEIMKRVIDGEKLTMEWLHRSPDGELIPCEITAMRIKHKGKYFGLGYIYDLRRIRKMEESIKLLESEAAKAYYDPLTGIYNRRYFDENLTRIIKTLSRSGGALSLMMIDVDNFKAFNDTYGHSEGDKCLKTIAQTLTKSVTRGDDFVARYGGEEFAVVLPNTRENGARLIANKLLENIRKCNIPHEKSCAADHITVSIGVTTGKEGNLGSANDYIKRADEMLYMSKERGRDRYFFTEL